MAEIILALLSGFFRAINVAFDSHNLHNLGIYVNDYAFIGFIFNFVYALSSLFIAKSIDKSYSGFMKISGKQIITAIACGIAGAAFALYTLKSINEFGASLVASFLPFGLIFMALFEWWLLNRPLMTSNFTLGLILISIGGFIASFVGGTVSLYFLLKILVLLNLS